MQDLYDAPPCVAPFLTELKAHSAVEAVVAFGSTARGEDDHLSDTDWAVVYNADEFNQLSAALKTMGRHSLAIPRKNGWALFDDQLRKTDLLLCSTPAELRCNFIGSRIPAERVGGAILFDRTGHTTAYIRQLAGIRQPADEHYTTETLIDYFQFAFDNASRKHARSDGYGFYFNYNIALHALAQLRYRTAGYDEYLHSPPQVIYRAWNPDRLQDFYELRGTLFLPNANEQKRKLLDAFYEAIAQAHPDRLQSVRTLCEGIYDRDYFWNLRDVAGIAPRIKAGVLYRSATPALYPVSKRSLAVLNERKIGHIIDLRGADEVLKTPYAPEMLTGRTYDHLPMDPYRQPAWFKARDWSHRDSRGTAYEFFLRACQPSWRRAVQAILGNAGATLVHCHAGKDRTGLFIAALQLLLGVDQSIIERDYLASGGDTDLKYLNIFTEFLEEIGGIQQFYDYQGVGAADQARIVEKFAAT